MKTLSNPIGILIVAGFSCSGKSNYIRDIVTRNPKFQNATPVYGYMFRQRLRDCLAPGDIFHLDLSGGNVSDGIQNQAFVSSHSLHQKTTSLHCSVTVDFLVAPADVIYQRISKRSHVGLGWRDDNLKGKYPNLIKLRTLQSAELSHRYDAWRIFFEDHGYQCNYFHSIGGSFLPLSNWSEAEAILKNSE